LRKKNVKRCLVIFTDLRATDSLTSGRERRERAEIWSHAGPENFGKSGTNIHKKPALLLLFNQRNRTAKLSTDR